MKKIKIIDLLNKIANGEEHKKIKYKDRIYYKGKFSNNVFYYTDDKLDRIILTHFGILNDEVEIIEDVEDIKENEEIIQLNTDWYKEVDMNDITNIQIALKCITDRLNEVIYAVNNLNKED